MIIDPKELNRLTQEAVEQGRREAERREREKAESEARQREADLIKADGIIKQIPGRCVDAARARQSYAIVMTKLGEGTDYVRPPGDRNYAACSEKWLVGAAKLVWDSCVGSRLQPELQFWHDGCGINSGFNIVVHW